MISFKSKTLLVIAPHPDDEVISCGGLISKIKEDGGKVFILFLTVGTTADFNKTGVSSETERIKEIRKVSGFFDYDGWKIAFLGDQYHLQLDTISQRDIIHEIERGKDISLETVRPDILAFPFIEDYNQDHSAASKAAFAACRPALKADKFVPAIILSYESPMNQWSLKETFKPNFFVELSEKNINDKIKGAGLYKSQKRNRGHLRSSRALKSLAVLRGSLIGSFFAEGYHLFKLKA